MMCPENRRILAWVEGHYAEVSAWLLLHDGRCLDDLDPWERCDVGYVMLTGRAPA